MRERVRQVSGLKIGFLEHKGGEDTILMIHGNSSCKEVFTRQFDDLKRAGLSIVAPDLPGHGSSDNSRTPASTYSFPGYARVLRELMSKLSYSRYHVLGWSLGGHIGLEMWATDARARSLLVTGTPPVSLRPECITKAFAWTPITALAGRMRFSNGDRERYSRAMMGTWLGRSHHLSSMVDRTDGNARRWMVRNGMAGLGIDEANAVATVDRPFGILQGIRDTFLRAEYFETLQFKNIWSGKPRFLKAGHAPHWEAPPIFNKEMLGFIEFAR